MSGEEAEAGCGSGLLLSLPEDVLELISSHLRPRDLCSLALCCRGLRDALSASDKAWISQCRRIGLPPHLLPCWRAAVSSYRALCRFLSAVAPLLGVWVHQNPELGNVVCVAWGFVSVVACRVIPQELGPHGLDAGPLLWAPVFEIVGDADGSPSRFFLHGRDQDEDYLYPGSVGPIDVSCNVLLLEVDVRPDHPSRSPQRLLHSQSLAATFETRDSSSVIRFCRSDDTTVPRPSLAPSSLLFGQLAFRDRHHLLDLVAGRVRLKLPPSLATAPLLPPRPSPSFDDSAAQLAFRRLLLIQMHKLHGGFIARGAAQLHSSSIISNNDRNPCPRNFVLGKRRTFFSAAGCFKDRLRQFMGRSSSSGIGSLISRNGTSLATGESKHIQLCEFLTTGDMVGLCLRAKNMRLSTYRAWPNMHDNRFALYKLPLQALTPGREYAGLWGGTFGWPPGRPSEHKPGKALFFLLLSYEEVEGNLHLIGTKILEGTHYVLHPNGSAMFTVKVDDEHTSEPFPWEFDGDSIRVEVKHTYDGEGISSGYGFRYPGSKPGSLFVIQNGLLAFVWKESKAVLNLQRLDLQELLRKGERVPSLPPIANFAYLTKSYSNVFVGFPSNSSCSSSVSSPSGL